jgi:hypothetical protein
MRYRVSFTRIRYEWALSAHDSGAARRVDERTRAADLISLRVCLNTF